MKNLSYAKIFIIPVTLFLFIGFSPFAARAACTDAQVDSWLASHSLTRNAENLYQANQVLGDCSGAGGGGIGAFISQLYAIMNMIVPFLVGLAVLIIIWGILGYISHAADEEKRKEARDFILWGVVGVFLMLSVWGLIAILVNTFNLDNSSGIVTKIYGAPQTIPSTAPTTVPELIARVNAVGSYVIPFLISLAVLIIIFGIFNYVRQADNEEKRAEARMFIIWGVISVFVMLSIWGFVNILVNTLSLNNAIPHVPDLPQIP